MAKKKKNLGVRPLNDKILIKRLEAQEKTKGGIFLPDTAKEKPKEGEVIALGEGKRLDSGDRSPFQVSVGDRVIFVSYGGTEIKIQGDEYMVMTEDEILAIIES